MKSVSSVCTMLAVGLVTLGTAILPVACSRAEAGGRNEAGDPGALLGATLPPVTLQSLDGSAVSLASRLSPGPTLLIVLGARDCFSCASYRLELGILKNRLPGITPILVGSGADQDQFREYFKLDHLESVALLDKDRSLITSLGLRAEPLALLVDSTGRILLVDSRSTSAAAQFPFGRLLPLLGGALQPVTPSIPKSGESK